MSGSLAESYSSGGPTLGIHRVKLLVVFGLLLPLSWIPFANTIWTLVLGILSIGLIAGLYAPSLRDAVVDAGLVAVGSGVILLATPFVITPLSGPVDPMAVLTELLLVFPVLLVATLVVSLGVWYSDWYLTLRHGSSARAVSVWVSGDDDPRISRVTGSVSLVQALLAVVSLLLIGVVILAVLSPTLFASILSPLTTPVEMNTDVEGSGNETVAAPYAGVSIQQVSTDEGLGAEVYVYSFETAEVITATNERTGERITLTPGDATGIVTGSSGDTISIEATRDEVSATVSTVTLTER